MDESRITELESCVAFQDKTIDDLSEVICRQQQEIDNLKSQYNKIAARLDSLDQSGTDGGEIIIDEVPPHY
jgi:SlyX protein